MSAKINTNAIMNYGTIYGIVIIAMSLILYILGIENDGVTSDGKVSVEHIECNAACDYAPVVMVNWEFYDNQTVQSVKDLVDGARAGNPPAPTRGPKTLRSWKQNSAVLAGISDGLANEGVQAGEPTLLGLKKAKGGA